MSEQKQQNQEDDDEDDDKERGVMRNYLAVYPSQ